MSVFIFAIRHPITLDAVYVGVSKDPAARVTRLRREIVRYPVLSRWLQDQKDEGAQIPVIILDRADNLNEGRQAALAWRKQLDLEGKVFNRRVGWERGRPRGKSARRTA